MSKKVIILQGLPGSGKTTWAKAFVEKNTDWVRVNRDDLRNMRGKYWLPKQEDYISSIEGHAISEAIRMGLNVIVDATNLNPKYLDALKTLLKDIGATYETKLFDTPVAQCIENDLKRPNPVGKRVIREMYFKYFYKPNPTPKHVEGLQSAIIVDIDGTLAHMKDRGPFEWEKVGTDLCDMVIASLVDKYEKAGHKIIIVSGRDERCRRVTEDWLDANCIGYDYFFMREAENMEKDAIIKQRIYDENIKGKFNVELVLDDRDQCVEMWRQNGLKCLQVAFGNF